MTPEQIRIACDHLLAAANSLHIASKQFQNSTQKHRCNVVRADVMDLLKTLQD